ncbi:MAG: hypothetical protein KF809_03365 [Chloroflexi bacterium]|nr:hypothetical protein [Chloroflexota bacterium]
MTQPILPLPPGSRPGVRRGSPVCALLAAVIATLLLATTTLAQVPDGTWRFQRTAFRDPAASDQEAIVMLLPEGWTAQGGVQWLPTWARIAFLYTHVEDPSTGITMDWLPIQDFMYFDAQGFQIGIGDNYQGKAYVPPITDPVDFVAQFWAPTVLTHLQGLRPVSVTQQPRVAQEFLTGFGGPGEAYAYTLRYQFDDDGTPWEQDVHFALLYSQANGITSWFVNFAYAVAGPRGAIDEQEALLSTIIASRITTPEWEATYRLVKQLFYQGIQQQMADTARFGELLRQYRAESQALWQQVTQERQEQADRQAQYVQEILGGVGSYKDPVTGRIVQLPSGRDQWVNRNGEYLSSDDPGFDPNTVDGQDWQRMEAHRH